MCALVLRGVWSSWRKGVAVGGHNPSYPASLTLGDGRWLGIVGRNGVGKSSLLRAIAGTAPISGGIVEVDHERLRPRRPVERFFAGVAYVEQDAALPGDAIAWADAVALATGTRPGLFNEDAIEDLRRRLVAAGFITSRGRIEPRRFDLVAALLSVPRVLLLDEVGPLLPGNDGVAGYQMIRRLLPGTTVVFVEHDIQVARAAGDALLLLRDQERPLLADCSDEVAVQLVLSHLPQIDRGSVTSLDPEANAGNLLLVDDRPLEALRLAWRSARRRDAGRAMQQLAVDFPFLARAQRVTHLSGGQRVVLTVLIHAITGLGQLDGEIIKHVDGVNQPALRRWIQNLAHTSRVVVDSRSVPPTS